MRTSKATTVTLPRFSGRPRRLGAHRRLGALLLALALLSPLSSRAVDLRLSDDATIIGGSTGTTNYGTLVYNEINTSGPRKFLLKFDLGALPAGVTGRTWGGPSCGFLSLG